MCKISCLFIPPFYYLSNNNHKNKRSHSPSHDFPEINTLNSLFVLLPSSKNFRHYPCPKPKTTDKYPRILILNFINLFAHNLIKQLIKRRFLIPQYLNKFIVMALIFLDTLLISPPFGAILLRRKNLTIIKLFQYTPHFPFLLPKTAFAVAP